MLVSVDAVVSAPRKSSMEARMDTFGEKAKRDGIVSVVAGRKLFCEESRIAQRGIGRNDKSSTFERNGAGQGSKVPFDEAVAVPQRVGDGADRAIHLDAEFFA